MTMQEGTTEKVIDLRGQICPSTLLIALREVNAGVLDCTQIDPEAEAAARAEAQADPDFSFDPFGTDDALS